MSLLIEALKCASATKKINHPLLNRVGVQCARTFAARAIHQTRGTFLRAGAEAQKLERDGIVVIPNFLNSEEFFRVKEQALAMMATSSPDAIHAHGSNTLEQFQILSHSEDDYAALYSFIKNERLADMVRYSQRRKVEPQSGHRVVERLTQGEGSAVDQESSLHSDVFYHNHKCWLYLGGVTQESGPLVYVKGSHRYGLTQAKYQYREANNANMGSRRISSEELEDSGLREESVTCDANTLVMVNTAGYHRRDAGVVGHQRLAIQCSYRFNPFMPTWMNTDKWLTRRNPLVAKFV